MTEPVKIPEWIEPYRALINNTGGNQVEDLLTRLRDEQHLLQTNLPVYILAVAVQSQVALLRRLQECGHLIPVI